MKRIFGRKRDEAGVWKKNAKRGVSQFVVP
jgi:hypothetical protein